MDALEAGHNGHQRSHKLHHCLRVQLVKGSNPMSASCCLVFVASLGEKVSREELAVTYLSPIVSVDCIVAFNSIKHTIILSRASTPSTRAIFPVQVDGLMDFAFFFHPTNNTVCPRGQVSEVSNNYPSVHRYT